MTFALECPHPDCRGVLRFAEKLPAGVYQCICHTIDVRLGWSADGPTLVLAQQLGNDGSKAED